MKKLSSVVLAGLLMTALVGCGGAAPPDSSDGSGENPSVSTPGSGNEVPADSGSSETPDGFVFVTGGSFIMGSPEDELEREADEVQHEVSVGDFYMATSEVTQVQYRDVVGVNPSEHQGDTLPVTNVTWYDAVRYCNALSERDGLTPAYSVAGQTVTWDRTANGYRLPTEAEWEYACRAETATPFHFGSYVEDSDANCYNAYGYNNDASGNWVNGYIEHTVDVGSYPPNQWGLYDMHGNAGEWVWDWYGDYDVAADLDPIGPMEGNYKVVRGGGWNDFPKNIRSAYRSAFPADVPLYSIGIRLVRSAQFTNEPATSTNLATDTPSGSKVLIAYFSATGNTAGLAERINEEVDADLFRIEREVRYRNLYGEALAEQREYAIPDLDRYLADAGLDIDDYDTILMGYCNWWASIPAPVRTFLMSYDMSGKTIIPFSSQGGGVFGQSISAVAKLAPESTIKEGLPVRYSSYNRDAILDWIQANDLPVR